MVQITPAADKAALIQYDILGVGEFQLPVLGQPGTPFGITSAFGVFKSASDGGNEAQKLSAWSMLIQSLSDSYPSAVRVLSRLDGEDVAAVFASWGKESKEYDPKASPSSSSSTGTEQPSVTTSDS